MSLSVDSSALQGESVWVRICAPLSLRCQNCASSCMGIWVPTSISHECVLRRPWLVQTTFQVPPWHSVLLASRLITMLKTDLETGLVERTVSALQWRHEAIMERQASCRWISENAASPAVCAIASPSVFIVVCGCFVLFLRFFPSSVPPLPLYVDLTYRSRRLPNRH